MHSRHKDHFFSQYTFFARAANGTLPEVSWLMPPSEACDHPCRDVRQPPNFPIALVPPPPCTAKQLA